MNPCASEVTERPEQYFDYDQLTGEILPKKGLSETAQRRALDTINHLGLNKYEVKEYRRWWILNFMYNLSSLPVSERQALIETHTVPTVEFAGATRMVAEQLRRDS